MQIDWWTLGLQTINVLILVWILSRFLFRPVADIVASARRRRKAAGRCAEAARGRGGRGTGEGRTARPPADASRAAKRAEGGGEGGRSAEDRADPGRRAPGGRQAARRRRRPRSPSARGRARAAAVADRASRLAVDIAGQAARAACRTRRGSPASSTAWPRRSPTLPRRPAPGSAPTARRCTLRPPRALTDARTKACRTALGQGARPRRRRSRSTADPDLIAGLELETPARRGPQQLPRRSRPHCQRADPP